MIQPSKNVGRLGACAEEARNQPQAGGCHPAVPLSLSQLAGPGAGTTVRHPPSRAGHAMLPRAGEPSGEGSRGSRPPPLNRTFPAGQVASKISKFSTFAQLKGREKTQRREAGALLESSAGLAGRIPYAGVTDFPNLPACQWRLRWPDPTNTPLACV